MPTYAGRLTSGKLPPSTSVRVVDPTGGPNGNTPADATLYGTRTYTGSVSNPVTTTSEGDLPEVYVEPGSYTLVFGGESRSAEAKLDAAEDDATEFATVAAVEEAAGTSVALPSTGAPGYAGYSGALIGDFGVELNNTQTSGGLVFDTAYPLVEGGPSAPTTDDVDTGYMTALVSSGVGAPVIHQAGWYRITLELDFDNPVDSGISVRLSHADVSNFQVYRHLPAGCSSFQEEYLAYISVDPPLQVDVQANAATNVSYSYGALTFRPLFDSFDPS